MLQRYFQFVKEFWERNKTALSPYRRIILLSMQHIHLSMKWICLSCASRMRKVRLVTIGMSKLEMIDVEASGKG